MNIRKIITRSSIYGPFAHQRGVSVSNKTQISKQTLSGVICDCDGTIIESALDFQEMYRRGEAYALSTGTVLGVCQVRFFESA